MSATACVSSGRTLNPRTLPRRSRTARTLQTFPRARERLALTILRETGQALTTQELAACILQRYGRPLEALSLKRLTSTIQANFCRRPDKIVGFDRSTYPGEVEIDRAGRRAAADLKHWSKTRDLGCSLPDMGQ